MKKWNAETKRMEIVKFDEKILSENSPQIEIENRILGLLEDILKILSGN